MLRFTEVNPLLLCAWMQSSCFTWQYFIAHAAWGRQDEPVLMTSDPPLKSLDTLRSVVTQQTSMLHGVVMRLNCSTWQHCNAHAAPERQFIWLWSIYKSLQSLDTSQFTAAQPTSCCLVC